MSFYMSIAFLQIKNKDNTTFVSRRQIRRLLSSYVPLYKLRGSDSFLAQIPYLGHIISLIFGIYICIAVLFLPFHKPSPGDRIASFRIVLEVETALPVADPNPVPVTLSALARREGRLDVEHLVDPVLVPVFPQEERGNIRPFSSKSTFTETYTLSDLFRSACIPTPPVILGLVAMGNSDLQHFPRLSQRSFLRWRLLWILSRTARSLDVASQLSGITPSTRPTQRTSSSSDG